LTSAKPAVKAYQQGGFAFRMAGTIDALDGTMSLESRLLLPLLAMLLLRCTSTVNIHSARSPTASFDRYRTFGFETNESALADYASSPRSIEVRNRVKQQAGKILEDDGYVRAIGGKPDLVLGIAAGRRERVIRHPQRARVGWLEEDEEDDFTEGAFVIDAFDAATEELVWHGSARAEVDPDRIDDERLRRAVTSVLATFPSRKADAAH
jgi:hypothetical protein